MNGLDALILPSRTTARWKEQFGRVIIEAQACGVPVIGSDSGAIPEVLGDRGLVVPERNPVALAQAMTRLASSPALCSDFRHRGRAHVLQYCTWKQVAERFLAIYRKAQESP
jgi:glycosyltransferase involved in cell wall biosynthesis